MMTDSSIPDVPAFADVLSPLERAALGLQDELSIFEIGLLSFTEEDSYSKRERLTDFLLDAIKAGQLDAYGDPDGWVVEANSSGLYIRTPYPRCNGHEGSIVPDYSQIAARIGLRRVRDSIQRTSLFLEQCKGDWCLVTRADYLAFLQTPEAFGIPVPNWPASTDFQTAPAPIVSQSTTPTPANPAQGEPAPAPQGEPDKSEQGAKPTRTTALFEAEDEALVILRNKLRCEPDFEEFWDYITKHDDTGTIADSTDDKLIWTGKSGQSCKTAKSTMRNRLTAAKKRNPFKP